MTYVLKFINSSNEEKIIGEFLSMEEANKKMVKELEIKGIKPFYYRCWENNPGETIIDFGSWSSFYKICKIK